MYAFVWTALAYRKQRRARAAGMAIANAFTAEGENNLAATATAADVVGAPCDGSFSTNRWKGGGEGGG